MDTLRIAILGSGYMGGSYAECIARYNTRVQLTAIAGGTRAPALAARYGVAYEPEYSALLARDDVDAVLIATPHDGHRDQALAAARAGKHVLIEKPMATSVRACDEMIAAFAAAGVVLEVIKTLRFRGSIARALRLIAEGAIGRVRAISGRSLFIGTGIEDKHWTMDADQGGMLLDMGCHNFDILCALAGVAPRRIYSTVTTYEGPPYLRRNAMTQINFDGDVTAQMWMSYEFPSPGLPDNAHRYLVVGEHGMLDIDGYGKLRIGAGESWEDVWQQPPIDYINRPLDPVRLEAFYTQTQLFVDDVLDGRTPAVSGADGRRAVAMVEAAWQSSQTGQSVALS
ncbi:MAG TPA: Gfo/Idh/MocA family oxidoreductase [Roseiflexaceae bacterium]|nr:Gfo/Idh/MocA family oxidoreductase [Roseiflexaceae bacterium]HMP42962.1 Gfo/Idh/MocA family oxidoreductase [Roseiflexaceae bacterium]